MAKKKPVGMTPLWLLLVVVILFSISIEISEAKKRVSIPDDLDDVVDEEEDEEWKLWGQKKKTTRKEPETPPDLSKMSPSDVQEEMLKQQYGPSYGFVKLRLGVRRTREDVPEIAMRWAQVLRTGSIEVKFMAVDLNTIMFTLQKGDDIEEFKDVVLHQPEAYEIKIGDQLYRRPGDPPLDEVVEKLRKEKTGDGGGQDTTDKLQNSNDEL